MFYLGGLLASVAGLPLFVGSAHTDEYFAWTIQPFLTAAFLGAAYCTALLLFILASRERYWANARAASVAAVVFGPLIVLATFVHLERFHLDADRLLTRAGTWAFIATYVYFSVSFVLVLALQPRAGEIDPPRLAPMPAWARVVLAIQAALLGGVGAALLVAPASTVDLWPWTLTELTARAVAAWMLAIGAAAACGVWENDWRRLRVPLAAYVVLPVLEAVALIRYSETVDWGHAGAWVLVGTLASMFVFGLYGLWQGLQAPDVEATRSRLKPEAISA
jgi:hypothetical protein